VCKFSWFTVLSLFIMVLISRKISSVDKLYNVWQNIRNGLIFTKNCQTVNIVKLKTPNVFHICSTIWPWISDNRGVSKIHRSYFTFFIDMKKKKKLSKKMFHFNHTKVIIPTYSIIPEDLLGICCQLDACTSVVSGPPNIRNTLHKDTK
jgi:hypothetical protein